MVGGMKERVATTGGYFLPAHPERAAFKPLVYLFRHPESDLWVCLP